MAAKTDWSIREDKLIGQALLCKGDRIVARYSDPEAAKAVLLSLEEAAEREAAEKKGDEET